MADEELLNFTGEEILPAANDHLLEPTHDVDIPVNIHRGQIARMQPALAINGLGGLLRHLVVAGHHQETPATDFSALPARHHLTCSRIDNLDLGMGHHLADGLTAMLEGVVYAHEGRRRRGLGLAEGDRDLLDPHLGVDPLHNFDRAR